MRQKLIAEFIGTFGIVFAPVALIAAGHATGEVGLSAAAWVSGLAVAAMIYTLGHISGAHFNPAVTVGFCIAKRFAWKELPGYWIVQIAGAILASGLVALLIKPGCGVHIPSIPIPQAIGIEAFITFFLMLVIISVATDVRAHGAFGGIAIGLIVVVGVFVAGTLSGGSMNPARSLGPALLAGGTALRDIWIYFVGPILGASIAAGVYNMMRQPTESQN